MNDTQGYSRCLPHPLITERSEVALGRELRMET